MVSVREKLAEFYIEASRILRETPQDSQFIDSRFSIPKGKPTSFTVGHNPQEYMNIMDPNHPAAPPAGEYNVASDIVSTATETRSHDIIRATAVPIEDHKPTVVRSSLWPRGKSSSHVIEEEIQIFSDSIVLLAKTAPTTTLRRRVLGEGPLPVTRVFRLTPEQADLKVTEMLSLMKQDIDSVSKTLKTQSKKS